jgi:hypothetical protein
MNHFAVDKIVCIHHRDTPIYGCLPAAVSLASHHLLMFCYALCSMRYASIDGNPQTLGFEEFFTNFSSSLTTY